MNSYVIGRQHVANRIYRCDQTLVAKFRGSKSIECTLLFKNTSLKNRKLTTKLTYRIVNVVFPTDPSTIPRHPFVKELDLHLSNKGKEPRNYGGDTTTENLFKQKSIGDKQ